MGHYCRIWGRIRANEQFSGRGHRGHVCKACQRLPREKRERIMLEEDLEGFLHQSRISPKNVARLKTLAGHKDAYVAKFAPLILEIARVHPTKRKRWLNLARRHRPLFDRCIELLSVEYFEGLLADYGDFESPLWRVLDQYRITLLWTSHPCDCGSGLSFRDCCLERENHLADQDPEGMDMDSLRQSIAILKW